MATLTLNKIWVTLANTGQQVSGYSARDRAEKYSITGDVRTYAGGRRRAVTQAGEVGTFAFEFKLISRTSVDLLHTWIGQTVQVRDHKGRQFFGIYTAVDVNEIVSRSTWNVAITMTVVTYDASV